MKGERGRLRLSPFTESEMGGLVPLYQRGIQGDFDTVLISSDTHAFLPPNHQKKPSFPSLPEDP